MKNKKFLVLVTAFAVVLTAAASFALFSDNKVHEITGQMHTFGIEVDVDDSEVGLMLPGDNFSRAVTVSVPEDYDGVDAVAAKVRFKVEITSDSMPGPLDLLEVDIEGEGLSILDPYSQVFVVEPGEQQTLNLNVVLPRNMENSTQGNDFEIKLITEAIQDKHTEAADFDGDDVVIIDNIVASREG